MAHKYYQNTMYIWAYIKKFKSVLTYMHLMETRCTLYILYASPWNQDFGKL